MPRDYVFGGKRDAAAQRIDRDLAFNTRGPIRPVAASDLGDFSDSAIAKGALGGRHTAAQVIERRFAQNRPPDNPEQVPSKRRTVRRKPRPMGRNTGR